MYSINKTNKRKSKLLLIFNTDFSLNECICVSVSYYSCLFFHIFLLNKLNIIPSFLQFFINFEDTNLFA